ncbi:4-deoxy-L-threo-5-hexosulose-uronateketol-isomerase [Spirochaeta thermophila DSM 6578]|uniref:4-deoxy-L-threo-5-hexosulose-uronate ketol-isomerase n=1 Tax=Winmispira thermophila (strain ATCC 700085 / DSM 6578 / Z-1203) TaxID=869211 RepID=G0GE30_WINT7|nr:5-dehydro-4-deoxy-D-glucuronate isomerase [Spirochaeta thermophila]AEJ60662.1 4-deoxy-L-threo-5-hexosulose-uronateketol-isomerase [Spirochaeta thermophila DSM 6578]
MMEVRYSIHPEHAKGFDTERLRNEFLVTDLFQADVIRLVYSHNDRIIVGGLHPVKGRLTLGASKELGTEYFFERREGGVVNIGGPGVVTIDGTAYEIAKNEAVYIGKGAREVSFMSKEGTSPAKFYFLSAPAHKEYPSRRITLTDARKLELGSDENSNARTIYQLIHPDVLETCQLCMGVTLLKPHNVWNTMPTHTHERRMEVYFYYELPADQVVFHLMGQPHETRHIVMRNEEAVLSPSWSIHSGVGTSNYAFIWGMIGENQTYTDMDTVPMEVLR